MISKRKIITTLLLGFVAIIFWYAQVVTIEPIYPFTTTEYFKKFYTKFVYPNRITYSVNIGVVIYILAAILAALPDSPKRLVKLYLDLMMKQQYFGAPSKHRITIFKLRRGYSIFPSYIWKCIKCSPKHISKGIFFSHLQNAPWSIFSLYLVQYVRRGQPCEGGSTTFFPVPEQESEVSSFVAYAFFQEMPCNVKLPNISGIKLSSIKSIDDLPDAEKRIVKKYIKDGKVPFEKLRFLHRYSQYLWATPIYDEKNNRWGAIIVDSESLDKDYDQNDDLVRNLKNSVDTIQTLLRKKQ